MSSAQCHLISSIVSGNKVTLSRGHVRSLLLSQGNKVTLSRGHERSLLLSQGNKVTLSRGHERSLLLSQGNKMTLCSVLLYYPETIEDYVHVLC
jgi:hypothetical protein